MRKISIIIVVVLLFVYDWDITDEPMHKVERHNSVKNTIQNTNNITGINKLKKREQNEELIGNSNFYSINPIINNAIIEVLYDECFDYYRDYQWSNYDKTNEKFKVQLKQLHKNCEEVNLGHPEFLLDNRRKFNEKKKPNHPQTLLTKIITQGSRNKLDYNEGIALIKQLKNHNPNILLVRNVHYWLYDFFNLYLISDVVDLLGTTNEWYVSQVLLYSGTLFSCNLGAHCSETSAVLLMYCYSNERFCGVKSYQDLIHTKLTNSQQYDINLVLGYLENLFEIENKL